MRVTMGRPAWVVAVLVGLAAASAHASAPDRHASPSGKYYVEVRGGEPSITMVEARRQGDVVCWTREPPLPVDGARFLVADGSPAAAMISPSGACLAFIGSDGTVARVDELEELVGTTDGVYAFVRGRDELVIAAPDMTTRAFGIPDARELAVPVWAWAGIRRELRAIAEADSTPTGALWLEWLGPDPVLKVIDEPGLAPVSRPAREMAPTSGRDFAILIGAALGLALVAAYCATRRHWRPASG